MLAALKNGRLDYKLPVLINNTHADEQPAIDIITGLFNTFATKEQISFKQLMPTVRLKISLLMSKNSSRNSFSSLTLLKILTEMLLIRVLLPTESIQTATLAIRLTQKPVL